MLKYIVGSITKADAGGGIDAVISTPKLDLDGESVDPMGLTNRDSWLANPLIYWAHEWAFNPSAEPIGKGTRLEAFPTRIESSGVFAPTAKAQNVRALVVGGFVRKTSIGFDSQAMQTVKGIPTHTAWALREWSIVPMPANTEATIVGVKSALRWLADAMAEPTETNDNAITGGLDASELLSQLDGIDNLHLTSHDGAIELIERGRRIATIRRRRVAFIRSH